MSKRFKILNGALDYLRTNDEGANPDAPTGTPLKLYQDWKKGARNISYDTSNWKPSGGLAQGVINPFGLSFGVGNLVSVPVSEKSKSNGALSAAFNAGGLAFNEEADPRKLAKFKPATCTVSAPDASKNDADAKSKLTGVEYNKIGRQSWTFPYGRPNDTAVESEIRAAIKTALSDNVNYTFQFTSEKL